MPDDLAMAPAYGGMFRPPPQRRVGVIIIVVVAAVALLVGAVVSGLWLLRQHNRFAENGKPCVSSGCAHGKCVHETSGDSYCASECSGDGDCPSAFVCDPTLSGRHHVCLKAGAETVGGAHRRARGH
jgi:hypothetical protein